MILPFLLFLSIAAFATKRVLRYLQYFQQEEYQGSRFRHWIIEKRAWDKKGTGCAIIGLAGALLPTSLASLMTLFAAIGFAFVAYSEEDPRNTGKISLKMTARAKRIYWLALAVSLCALAAIFLSVRGGLFFWLSLVLLIQLLPLSLETATFLLKADENARQQKFIDEAKANLARVHPYVIAITGSFGKTSTKAILGKLLESALAPTFWPPKSINTPMGITREIRENLKLGHKYAVVEMGAYQQGSIARLCELTPPNAAIVTAVGLMHLERFGSPENVYKAKSELPARVPQAGILVCNGDNPGARRIATEFPKEKTYLYGLDTDLGALDSFIDQMKIGPDGTSFVIHWQGSTYPARTRMHGRPALSNILASFTMGVALGAQAENLIAAIGALEPFDNRLEVKNMGAGLQINDAYNSNPDGFLAALEVLRELPAEKRILMTPGMIELGDQQASENERIAKVAASICDTVIVVGPVNRLAFQKGLEAGGLDQSQQKYVETRDEAFRTLAEIRKPSDIVLLENDLPDLYEGPVSF